MSSRLTLFFARKAPVFGFHRPSAFQERIPFDGFDREVRCPETDDHHSGRGGSDRVVAGNSATPFRRSISRGARGWKRTRGQNDDPRAEIGNCHRHGRYCRSFHKKKTERVRVHVRPAPGIFSLKHIEKRAETKLRHHPAVTPRIRTEKISSIALTRSESERVNGLLVPSA
jgi:hypothetical protein